MDIRDAAKNFVDYLKQADCGLPCCPAEEHPDEASKKEKKKSKKGREMKRGNRKMRKSLLILFGRILGP